MATAQCRRHSTTTPLLLAVIVNSDVQGTANLCITCELQNVVKVRPRVVVSNSEDLYSNGGGVLLVFLEVFPGGGWREFMSCAHQPPCAMIGISIH